MLAAEKFPLEPALWFDTAQDVVGTSQLSDSMTADILIIGAGYAGLSTALHLASLGYRPVVLEARQIGFGASGRNGGQLVPGLKWDPDELVRKLGETAGEKIIQFAGQTASEVFRIIEQYGLNVPMSKEGWLQPAHNAYGLKLAEKRVQQWLKHGADVTILSANEMSSLLGTQRYVGGWLDKRGGGIQPLSYVRELARAAIAKGVRIFTDSPVSSIRRLTAGWEVHTEYGPNVRADRVVVCTNAYSDGLWPNVQESIVDANTYQIATEPLPAHIASTILPGGQVASDTKNLLFYFRKDHTGRFIMGGRGPLREPCSNNDWAHLQRAAIKLFPQLESVKWQYRWCGRVAITRDYFPHLHEPAPGLLINIGCMGRGIGLQTCMGKAIADYVHSGDKHVLPVGISHIKPLPLYALKRLYAMAVVSWYRITDGGA